MFSAKVAINNQYACHTIEELDKQFERSCDMCCNSPSCYMDCDHCKVAMAHEFCLEELRKIIGGHGDGKR